MSAPLWTSRTLVCLNGFRSWYLSRFCPHLSWFYRCSFVSVSLLKSRNSVLRSRTSACLSKSSSAIPSSRRWTSGNFMTHLYDKSCEGSGPSTSTCWGYVAGFLSFFTFFIGRCSLVSSWAYMRLSWFAARSTASSSSISSASPLNEELALIYCGAWGSSFSGNVMSSSIAGEPLPYPTRPIVSTGGSTESCRAGAI